MSVVLPLYSGPSKQAIIALAYEECGVAAADFDVTGEEYATGLRRLNALMADWKAQGLDLRYNQPPNGVGTADELSGIPADTINTVASALAFRIAPTMGATLSPDSRGNLARSFSLLQARYASIPRMAFPVNTPHGQGNRRYGYGVYDAYGTYQVTDGPQNVVDG